MIILDYKHIIPLIDTAPGALGRAGAYLARDGGKRLVVSDENTREAAGRRLCESALAAGARLDELVFPREELTADESAIGALLAAARPEHTLLVAVGSGTLNDLCKYVSFKLGKPFAVVGTAPSMDGYASSGAAMTLGGVKVTPQTHCPRALFCDPEILKDAPAGMLCSGLGDMLGKVSSLADWELSHAVTGEAMPEPIRLLMRDALTAVTQNALAAARRDTAAVQALTEGLILSGIAMTLYGDSRPASGTEHHLSHYWESTCLAEGRKPAPHGQKVGVATLCALRLWQYLPRGSARPALAAAEKIAAALPPLSQIEETLAASGAPLTPAQVGVHPAMLRDSVLYAKDRKPTYTLLRLLHEHGLLEKASRDLARDWGLAAAAKSRCFVLDLDGTTYLGEKLIPGAREFLERVEASGREYVFFTNNSSKDKREYLEKLAALGIAVPPEKMLTSAQVLIEFLQTERAGKSVWVAGTDALLRAFREAGIEPQGENPDIAVIGFDTGITYEKLQKLHNIVSGGAEFLAVHTDYACPVQGGSMPDCGSLAKVVTASARAAEPPHFGKPSARALGYIARQTGFREAELCFVGDRLYTDIAVTAGTAASSVLVLSGESREEDVPGYPAACPDMIAPSVADIAFPAGARP
ncbi:MAG: iron-containing alcohol dehydrogenase [Oscillospiraceae bacterium]|nr:iron-containing alcohol dehydrogenase [Oscillospiraceae bacterium]